jgi:hypothetical protein
MDLLTRSALVICTHELKLAGGYQMTPLAAIVNEQ